MTNSPRSQVLLRPAIRDLILRMSQQRDISVSKQIAELVVEALVNRNLYQPESIGQVNSPFASFYLK